MRVKVGIVLALCVALLPGLASAQQTGTIVGKVLDTGGLVLPGVTVEARSNVLPAPRVTVTGDAGEFRLPALPPGDVHRRVHAVRDGHPHAAGRRCSCGRTPPST